MAGLELLSALFVNLLLLAMVIAIIGSLILHGIVLFLASIALHVEHKSSYFWRRIWGVWLCTGISQVISFMCLNFINFDGNIFPMIILQSMITGVLAFLFQYFFAFKNDNIEIRKPMAITFAIMAALCCF